MGRKTKITTVIEKIDMGKVKVTRDVDEANKLLAEGWILMNAGTSHLDSAGYQAKVHFILAKQRG